MKDEITASHLVDLRAFHEDGFLFEANRQFFHPLGLALALELDDEGHYSLHGIYETTDPQGYFFDHVIEPGRAAKSQKILARLAEIKAIRERELGYPDGIQPLARGRWGRRTEKGRT